MGSTLTFSTTRGRLALLVLGSLAWAACKKTDATSPPPKVPAEKAPPAKAPPAKAPPAKLPKAESLIQFGTVDASEFPPKLQGSEPRLVMNMSTGWWCPGGGQLCLPCAPAMERVSMSIMNLQYLAQQVERAEAIAPEMRRTFAARTKALLPQLQELEKMTRSFSSGELSHDCGPIPPPDRIIYFEFDYCRFCELPHEGEGAVIILDEGESIEDYCPAEFIQNQCPHQ